jgi:hypothetical protein
MNEQSGTYLSTVLANLDQRQRKLNHPAKKERTLDETQSNVKD